MHMSVGVRSHTARCTSLPILSTHIPYRADVSILTRVSSTQDAHTETSTLYGPLSQSDLSAAKLSAATALLAFGKPAAAVDALRALAYSDHADADGESRVTALANLVIALSYTGKWVWDSTDACMLLDQHAWYMLISCI